MLRHAMLLLYAATSNCLVRETVNSMNGENYFKYTGSSYQTINLNNSTCTIVPNNKQFYFIKTCSDYCDVDLVQKVNCAGESVENDVFFPKCCPPNYAYEMSEHKCVLSNVTISDEVEALLLVKAGLENCKVTVDFIVENVDDTMLLPINPNRSVNFQNRTYSYGNYCLDNILDDDNFVLRICENIDICKSKDYNGDGIRCVKKCCPDGQMYNGPKCSPGIGHGLPVKQFNDSIRDADDNFAVVVSENCKRYPAPKSQYEYYVEKNGSIFVEEMGVIKEYLLDETYYCIEHIELNDYVVDEFMLCYIVNEHPELKFKLTRVVLLISAVCLFLTLVGHLLMQELRNLIGKIITCYCASLFLAFVALSWIQFFPYAKDFCTIAGFIIAYFVIAAFTWMNIISYDIWRVLGSMKMQYGNHQYKERKKFVMYNLYGWSIPTLITTFAVIDHTYWILPQSLHAHIGHKQCMIEKYLDGNYGYHFFMVAPCGLLILSNLVIYVRTVTYILKVKSEIDKMKDLDDNNKEKKTNVFNRDKERIIMVFRIFIIMGVSWLFEIILSFVNFKENAALNMIEIILDIFNCLQGVFIFCIFMLKAKVLYAVAKKFGFKIQIRDRSPVSTSTTETMLKHSPDVVMRKFR